MADSSKDIQLRELKDMVAELKNLIKTLQETVDAERYKGIPVTKECLNLEDTKCPVCGADLVSIGGRIRPPGTGIYTGTAEGG